MSLIRGGAGGLGNGEKTFAIHGSGGRRISRSMVFVYTQRILSIVIGSFCFIFAIIVLIVQQSKLIDFVHNPDLGGFD